MEDRLRLDESPLKPEELVGLCQLLWTAGNETTTNLLSNAALLLQERAELLEMLRAEPARIPSMVEEMLRLQSPISYLARRASEDLEFRGQKIRQGDVLMVMFAPVGIWRGWLRRPVVGADAPPGSSRSC